MPVSKKRSTHRNKKNRGQKLYRMKGCSTKKHLGGATLAQTTPTSSTPTNSNVYPNQGPTSVAPSTLNPQTQKGGNCGCGGNLPFQSGGAGMPYYGGVTGNAWYGGNTKSWPGGNNVSSGGNHFPMNNYKYDASRDTIVSGANKPFLRGGRKRGTRKGRGKIMKGGLNLSNTLGQDFLNLARQGVSGVGNMFNSYRGYAHSPSPMPWKNQLPSTLTSDALKIMKI